MAAVQLAFTLRTSTNVKTVHLLGSWDNYSGQLPLSKDAKKAGSWKGNFRFQGSTLQPGKRYWYYYIMDGYHVSHDPAKPFTKEPTTGRSLNVLDVPKGPASSVPAPPLSIQKHRPNPSAEIPTGRGLSPSRIVHPKPSKPYASRNIREADYNYSYPDSPVDDLSSQLEKASLYSPYSASPPSSVGSSLSSRSSSSGSSGGRGSSSPSSLSSLSDRSASSCRCNRYGITRKGEKVLLDCGGSRCGYTSEESSSGCSESDESSEDERPAPAAKPKPRYREIAPRSKQTASSGYRRR